VLEKRNNSEGYRQKVSMVGCFIYWLIFLPHKKGRETWQEGFPNFSGSFFVKRLNRAAA
jgi:hypothetical protein